MSTSRPFLALASAALALGMLLPAAGAHAASPMYRYVDANTGSDSGNTCASASTPCATVNQAIGQASSGDIILIAYASYGNEPPLVIDKALTLSGQIDPQSGNVPTIGAVTTSFAPTKSGAAASTSSGPVLTVDAPVTARIVNLALKAGSGTQGAGLDVTDSGADVSLQRVTIGNNSAIGSDGNPDGGSGRGGGIYNAGTITMADSTISANGAYGGTGLTANTGGNGGDGYGGGIYNAGTLTIERSVIEGNVSQGGDGGRALLDTAGNGGDGHGGGLTGPGPVFIYDSTIANNKARGGNSGQQGSNSPTGGASFGGGIDVPYGATYTLDNVTIADNDTEYSLSDGGATLDTADEHGAGVDLGGGATLGNTILADNYGDTQSYGQVASDCAGLALGTIGGNVVGSTCSFSSSQSNDLTGDPGLGGNQYAGPDGGPTDTMPIPAGSDAIGNGLASNCAFVDANGFGVEGVDQRGLPRPPACDSGAFQHGPYLTDIMPQNIQASASNAATQVTLDGYDFDQDADASTQVQVEVNGSPIPTTPSTSTQLTATIPAADLASASELSITVIDGYGTATAVSSNPQLFYVTGSSTTTTGSATGTTGSSTSPADANSGGYGPNTPGNIDAGASGGTGSVALTLFSGNPSGFSAGSSTNYFDVRLSQGNTFTRLVLTDCDTGGANTLSWFNGTAWTPVTSDPKATQPAVNQGCIAVVLDTNSSPTLAQLTGTYFAATSSNPTLARVSNVTVRRIGSRLTFHWRSRSAGITGFTLYAGRVELSRHVIAVHRGSQYSCRVHSTLPGPYTLHVLLSDGSEVSQQAIPAP